MATPGKHCACRSSCASCLYRRETVRALVAACCCTLLDKSETKTCRIRKCLFGINLANIPLLPQLFESVLILRRVLCENTTLVKLYRPLRLETSWKSGTCPGHGLAPARHRSEGNRIINYLLSDETLRTAQTWCMLGKGQNFLSEEPLL